MIDFKIAGYLDEAGENPENSCETLNHHNISYTVLRNAWGDKNICDSSDLACQKLKTILNTNNISVVSICSNLGNVPANQLMKISDSEINRTFDIASYFNCGTIRILAGTKTSNDIIQINEWMNRITDFSIKNNITPMLEITNDAHILEPSNIANLLSKFQRWKILYDPVQIIIKRKINPFVRYWSLLKNKVIAIDVRDYVVGRGFKPPGFGDTLIKQTLEDANNSNYNGWLFIEPNLGRKYGQATSKSQTFAVAMESLQYIIK